MRKLTIALFTAPLAALTLLIGAYEVSSKVNPCTRACAVVFVRGGSNCVKKIVRGSRNRQRQCKTDFGTTCPLSNTSNPTRSVFRARDLIQVR